MTYEMKPLSCDPAKLAGLSEKLIVSHYEYNYGGTVKRLNAIAAKLADLDFGAAPGFVLNGLKREELIAANSMHLHEVYFESLNAYSRRDQIAFAKIPASDAALRNAKSTTEYGYLISRTPECQPRRHTSSAGFYRSLRVARRPVPKLSVTCY